MATSTPDSSIAAAIQRLDTAIDQAKKDLDSYKQQGQPTAEDLQELQKMAAAGELGADMQSAAALVSSGQESWLSLCSGKSSNSHLLDSHVSRMLAEHGGAITASIQGDTSFDPKPDDLYR
ncbi:hypothetical protein [Nocardia amamiensis]|uniref:hypothetical protein n=1 Tax=Nocardia amamiensis TaxID=404578 RepID=UPI00083189E0|nr:hypothetical protein [Nocardia amamiensis]